MWLQGVKCKSIEAHGNGGRRADAPNALHTTLYPVPFLDILYLGVKEGHRLVWGRASDREALVNVDFFAGSCRVIYAIDDFLHIEAGFARRAHGAARQDSIGEVFEFRHEESTEIY